MKLPRCSAPRNRRQEKIIHRDIMIIDMSNRNYSLENLHPTLIDNIIFIDYNKVKENKALID